MPIGTKTIQCDVFIQGGAGTMLLDEKSGTNAGPGGQILSITIHRWLELSGNEYYTKVTHMNIELSAHW